jgi:cytochrome oxidase Cu insertion factor (SCO1/SenC/PrrC family)
MKTPTIFCALLCAAVCPGLPANVVEIEPQTGRQIPSIQWIDDTGGSRTLSDLAGYPVVLLPVYTRCRTACISNADQLKKAIATASSDQSQFRVLLFSFDPADTPKTLAAYRKRQNIPLAWSIGTSSQHDIDGLLEAIGFQSAKAGSEFMHSNLVVFLDSKLQIAKWIYGTDYSSKDVDLALKVAAGERDWVGQHWQWLYALCLFGASGLCVMLWNLVIQLRQNESDLDRTIGPRSDPI